VVKGLDQLVMAGGLDAFQVAQFKFLASSLSIYVKFSKSPDISKSVSFSVK
jgi:hypothetical protein